MVILTIGCLKLPIKTLIQQLSDQYTPEGETFSFYLDSPIIKEVSLKYTSEVVHKIDNTYRTINDRKGRFITGLSMGGHGAMYIS
jgi:S-formylglutathione hydrolase FrmB